MNRTAVARLVAGCAITVLTVAGCGSSSGSSADDSAGAGDSDASASGSSSCDYVTDTSGQVVPDIDKPPATPVATGPVQATIATNFGDLPITLDGTKAPCAVNSFLSLAEQGYYDKTDCVRVTNIAADESTGSAGFHILQCGDPTGSQAGTPGYRFAEEVDGSEKYAAGTIAMAKTSAPDTTGAQFFIVYGATALDPSYTELGTLSDAGLKVAKKAGAAASKGKGAQYDGPLATKVTITSVKQD